MKTRIWFITIVAILALQSLALGQSQNSSDQPQPGRPSAEGVALAPTRFELPMLPGTEKTVVVNIIYNSTSADAQPTRLMASLGDWTITKDGRVEFNRANTMANSACPWVIYSPGEVTVIPGRVHPIRVTISVPKDATPGDHTASLLIEARPDNIKAEDNKKQMLVRFRMAAVFYIMVPQLTHDGSLRNLKAEPSDKGLIVTATLKNEGNSHLRPVHSVKIVDRADRVVAELPESESLPLPGGSEISFPLLIERAIPPGAYSVQYRVDFRKGGAITEGRTDLVVKEHLAEGRSQNRKD